MKHLFLSIILMFTSIASVMATESPTSDAPQMLQIQNQVFLSTHRVRVTIANQVATTRIEQVFINESDVMAEGNYVFPLPAGATVSDLVMYVDGEPITAKILSAEEARQIYEEIVRQLRDPALLEYIGQNAIQANVFPIQPRDEVKIEIEYNHVLPVENGLIAYSYPLRTDQLSPLPVNDLAISVNVTSNERVGSIYSPSHDIAINREDDFTFQTGYETTNAREGSDFKLYYSLADSEIDANLITYRESADEAGFFLLMLAPPFEVDSENIVPKDVTIVLDQSGSMFGDKWEQAREAAYYVLDNLNPEDRFNVIAFSTGVRRYATELQSPQETEGAKQWLSTLEAIGGTDIDGALKNAFETADSERQTVILFLTDGVPTEGETNTATILENAEVNTTPNIRLFTFGVGDDVDTFLLDQLNQTLNGTGAYVRPDERIDEEVSNLYNKISSPVLTNLELNFGDMRVEDFYPSEPLPDLFLGSQLIIAGRYFGSGTATIKLTGNVNGASQTFTYDNLEFAENAGGEILIPRLWATRRIGALLNSIRLNGENPELVDSIIRLSTRYGIITPYTSFLIEENDIFTQAGRDEVAQEAQIQLGALDDDGVGGEAVESADRASSMEEAEVAAPIMPNAPAESSGISGGYIEPIQVVGNRTFVLRDGTTWVDTTYDADTMQRNEIEFLSDAYFDLLDNYPEIGVFLAIGDHIILVIDGQAYEIR